MNIKKYMVLMIGGSVCLILIVAALVMLLGYRNEYKTVSDDLNVMSARLHRLQTRVPYPSEENVSLMQRNLSELHRFYDQLNERMRADQVEPEALEPAQFPLLLERAVRRLNQDAAKASVTLPDGFAFGFDRYALGELPEADAIPRLVIQFKSIEQLCSVLYDAGISSVISVQRQVFETGMTMQAGTPQPAPSSARGRRRRSVQQQEPTPMVQASNAEEEVIGGIATREHYILEFDAYDPALWGVLNRFAACKLFVVVTDVTLKNQNKDLKQAVTGVVDRDRGEPAREMDDPLSREERIVAGRSLVRVVLKVDVYRFLEQEEGGEA